MALSYEVFISIYSVCMHEVKWVKVDNAFMYYITMICTYLMNLNNIQGVYGVHTYLLTYYP